jgi:HEPN domain-containing protein
MNATPDELTAEAGRWLRFAAEDLEAAEALRSAPGVAARHVATLAQQSAEKAVKAGLVLLDVDPPRTHNLELLVDLLPDDWAVHESSADLARLSLWLVESRYPGEWPETTASAAAKALADARDVLATMSSDLSARGVAAPTS